jgi:anti-sigma factor RsiW
MTDCPNGDVRDLLPDYLHDRLESAARTSVERHLAGCAACRDELALLRDLRGTLRRAPRIDVAAVAAAVPAYRPAARKSWASGWRVAAAVTAIAVGGASIALLRSTQKHEEVAQGPSVAPYVGSTSRPATTPQPMPVQPSTPAVARAEPPVSPSTPSTNPAPAPRGQELAMAGGTIADLSDGELSDLLGDIESLDAVPSTEVESTESLLTGRNRGRHD